MNKTILLKPVFFFLKVWIGVICISIVLSHYPFHSNRRDSFTFSESVKISNLRSLVYKIYIRYNPIEVAGKKDMHQDLNPGKNNEGK